MNKLIILAIVVLTISIFGFGLLNEKSEIKQANTVNQGIDIEVIKPPKVGISDDISEISKDKFDKSSGNRVIKNEVYARGSKENIKAMRNELVKLHQDENVSYETLGTVLEKYKEIKYNTKSTKSSLERIQYNLTISRKISNLMQKLHHDVNGKKELDAKVLAEITALQKQLLVPNILTRQAAQ